MRLPHAGQDESQGRQLLKDGGGPSAHGETSKPVMHLVLIACLMSIINNASWIFFLLSNASSRDLHLVRPNKPTYQSLEQRKGLLKGQTRRWVAHAPQTPNPLKDFSKPHLSISFFIVFLFFYWRIIVSQYCVGYWHTTTWISRKYTYVTSFRTPTPHLPHLSSCHRVPQWASCVIQKLPPSYLFYTW